MFGVIRRGRDDIEGLVDRPGAREISGMGLAGIDDALELGVRQQAVGDNVRRQARPIAGLGRRDGGHGGRLHQPRRMDLRSGNTDRLKYVSFIKRFRDAPACVLRPVRGFVDELDSRGLDTSRRG
jgi:hypothetical protein